MLLEVFVILSSFYALSFFFHSFVFIRLSFFCTASNTSMASRPVVKLHGVVLVSFCAPQTSLACSVSSSVLPRHLLYLKWFSAKSLFFVLRSAKYESCVLQRSFRTLIPINILMVKWKHGSKRIRNLIRREVNLSCYLYFKSRNDIIRSYSLTSSKQEHEVHWRELSLTGESDLRAKRWACNCFRRSCQYLEYEKYNFYRERIRNLVINVSSVNRINYWRVYGIIQEY